MDEEELLGYDFRISEPSPKWTLTDAGHETDVLARKIHSLWQGITLQPLFYQHDTLSRRRKWEIRRPLPKG